MPTLLRRVAERAGVVRDTSSAGASATRPLRLLIAGSVVLPLIIFGIASFISYRQHFTEANDRLARTLAIVHEHAAKVFETFEFSARFIDELTGNLTDAEVRAQEAALAERLKSFTRSLPQLRDLWIVGGDGTPLVSGTIYPMPRIDLSDRNYFKVHRENMDAGIYISEVLAARAAETRFFAISRPRVVNGRFSGVTIVSIAPEYFTEFYSNLPQPSAAALVRPDGQILARFPDSDATPRSLPPNSHFLAAMREKPDKGIVHAPSVVDGKERLFAYQRLTHVPIYVTTGIAASSVVNAWLMDMASHLIFGVPATLALLSLGFIALRRTERLQEEVTKRQSAEEALRQSQKMEAIGRLSGGIAHDFNNLLTVILGNVDMALRRVGEDNRVHRLLDAARQASERAAALVQRLLAFSRQHPQEVKSVDINRLVQSMSELLRRTIGETVTVETVLAGGLWKVAVDANQLENAILNLAVNARDAMSDGGRLTIETSNSYLDEAYVASHADSFAPGQYVLLAISDSGSGMSRDVIERAFEPFFTTKPTGMGTGLGLSMVYGFVKQSNGHVKIYSEIGEGTTIKLYFPRLVAEQDALPVWSADQRSTPRLVPSFQGTETILLVEDDEEVRRFATDVLGEHGYTVHAAKDGAEALGMLDANESISMLFTDVVLPGGMNGRQLADEAVRRRPNLKVLFATGYTRNAIIHQGRLDAEVELLTKPFTAEALARKLRQILDAGSAKPRSAQQA